MKRLLFVITLVFFTIASCSKSKPKGILSEGKMSDLMTEVYVVDGYLNILPIDSSRKLMPVLYQSVFDRFGIDSAQFQQNMDFYYGNPILLEKLTGTVKKTLEQYEKDAMRQDSIQQAFVQDSINTVQRWTRLAQEAKNLILQVHIDTTAYSFPMNNERFFQRANVSVKRHELVKSIPLEPAEDDVETEEEAMDDAITDSISVAVDTTGVDSLKIEKWDWRQDSTLRKWGLRDWEGGRDLYEP